jgi:hypothetical protein
MTVILDRGGGDLDRSGRLGLARFEQAVRREITTRAGRKPSVRILGRLFAVLADPAGVIAHRLGALERVPLLMQDWAHNQQRLAETERRMVAVLGDLELTALGHLDLRHFRGRRRGDPGRNRRSHSVLDRTRAGQARRPGAAGAVRHLHRAHRADRPRTTPTPGRRPASGLGSPTRQPRLRRPLHAPDHPRVVGSALVIPLGGTVRGDAHCGPLQPPQSALCGLSCLGKRRASRRPIRSRGSAYGSHRPHPRRSSDAPCTTGRTP